MTPGEQVTILVVDDEPAIRASLRAWLEEDGYQVATAADGPTALTYLQEQPAADVVLLDVRMPGMDGLEVLQRIRADMPDLVVVMITAFGTVETAVQALKLGAHDFIPKPFDLDNLARVIHGAIQQRLLLQENVRLKAGIGELTRVDEIVGQSEAMQQVLELIATVAPTDATVMICGETGTGKELVARAIHANSPRRFFPLITMNCGAVPDDLLESELFGHEQGAFTGASHRRKGKVELASGGTLFLDEVGNVSPRMQMELLRVLETKCFMRLGGSREIEVDFRLVSATNTDLEAALREDRFREDLYFRLNVFRIEIPPLRERQEDILPLAMHFVRTFVHPMGVPVQELPADCVRMLQQYSWPGNVRELRNVIERAVVLAGGGRIESQHLRFQFPELSLANRSPRTCAPVPLTTGNESLAEVEMTHIQRVLEAQGGNITHTARILGIDRATLYNKIRKYGIER